MKKIGIGLIVISMLMFTGLLYYIFTGNRPWYIDPSDPNGNNLRALIYLLITVISGFVGSIVFVETSEK